MIIIKVLEIQTLRFTCKRFDILVYRILFLLYTIYFQNKGKTFIIYFSYFLFINMRLKIVMENYKIRVDENLKNNKKIS